MYSKPNMVHYCLDMTPSPQKQDVKANLRLGVLLPQKLLVLLQRDPTRVPLPEVSERPLRVSNHAGIARALHSTDTTTPMPSTSVSPPNRPLRRDYHPPCSLAVGQQLPPTGGGGGACSCGSRQGAPPTVLLSLPSRVVLPVWWQPSSCRYSCCR